MSNNEIHIYIFDFSINNSLFAEKFNLLSEEEKVKVERYKFTVDKMRAIKTYVLRRLILSKYLYVSPEKIIFSYNQNGKPSIANSDSHKLHFNYAHTGETVVFALNRNCEIGVDIELIKNIPELELLVQKYLSDEEIYLFDKIKNSYNKLKYFYKIWTRKEALLKGIGKGISDEMRNFSVISETKSEHMNFSISLEGKNWIVNDLELRNKNKLVGSVAYPYDADVNKKLIYFDTNFDNFL